MSRVTDRRASGWFEVDALERQLKNLSSAAAKLKRAAEAGLEHAEQLAGAKGFAPLVAAGLAADAMVTGLEAQIQVVANQIAVSKDFLDRGPGDA